MAPAKRRFFRRRTAESAPPPAPQVRRSLLAEAEASGSTIPDDRRHLLRLLDRLLAAQAVNGPDQHHDSRILVVTDDEESASLPGGVDTLVFPCERDDLQVFLARNQPWDLIVIDVTDPLLRREAFLTVSVASRGDVVVANAQQDLERPEHGVARLVTSVFDHWPGDGVPVGLNRRALPHLASAWHRVEKDGPHLVVGIDADARVKLGEEQADALLEAEPHRGRVIARREGASFTPLSPRHESHSPLAGSWRDHYDVPTLSLREYADVVAVPGQVLFQDSVILPDSFRHIGRDFLRNRYAPPLGPSFVHDGHHEPERVLEGPHFYWDSEFRGHFGHLMTEMLSRMWAFDAAKQRHPDLKVFMAKNKRRGLFGYEVTVLEAFGATKGDITFVKEPVRVETMLAATPMFSQPEFVHPEIVEVWDRLSTHLAAQAPDRDRPRRIFIGRKPGKRACTNAEEVEARFVERGFEVIYPEEHPLPEQARLFREAEVLAGYAGSGLFNTLLSTTPKHVIMISSESYTAENEWMIAAARGHHVDVVWCEAEIASKKEGFNMRAFHSDFTFDPAREGLFLDEVLGALD